MDRGVLIQKGLASWVRLVVDLTGRLVDLIVEHSRELCHEVTRGPLWFLVD